MRPSEVKTTYNSIESLLADFDTKQPISMKEALKRVRHNLPDCELTDRELYETIAVHVIARGYQVVFFDRRSTDTEIETPIAMAG